MSTTRPYSPGDRGPEPSGASGASEGRARDRGVRGGVSAGQAAVIGTSVPSSPSAASAPSSSSLVSVSGRGRGRACGGGGRQGRRLVFDDQSGVVPLARDFTRQALYAWGWLPSATADQRAAAEDVLLVVSELVTNACLHAEGPDELWITCEKKVIRLEVSDRGTGQPAPRTPHRAGRPGGHGMFIVQRLCLDWGVVVRRGRGQAGVGRAGGAGVGLRRSCRPFPTRPPDSVGQEADAPGAPPQTPAGSSASDPGGLRLRPVQGTASPAPLRVPRPASSAALSSYVALCTAQP